MADKFLPLSHYQKSLDAGYRLLPFKFSRLESDQYVLTNEVGQYVLLERKDLDLFIRHALPAHSQIYETLKSNHFLIDEDSDVVLDLLGLKLRTKLRQLANFTSLHIFVVSLRCEHSCPYCQVSRQSNDRLAFDMDQATAERALAAVFKSPSAAIKIEFQGGEPLLNFGLVKFIIGRAEEINEVEKRDLRFVIATNLALLDDEILSFCREHKVLISTSLDGPRELHNRNRPRPGGDSYERTLDGIARVRSVLGHDQVSALMTTTQQSLSQVKAIIDEYVRLQFEGIFLRTLSPYGFAIKTKSFASYNADAWMNFFVEGLDYVISLNKQGIHFVEYYSATLLTKMLTPNNPGYVDLMNPAGIGISVLVYNYDGDVYASDEGRMLAEMGDKTFRLGNLQTDSYESILLSEKLLDPIEQSFTASAPMCSECAFEPYCGADPVYHHATQGDYVGRKPESDFCRRNMAIFRHLIKLMRDDGETASIFRRWVQ